MANEYVDADEFKATLELSNETFADDDIDRAISAASRAIDNITGRRFWRDPDATQVRYYTPTNAARIWIDDLETLTALAIDDDDDDTYSQAWTTSDYALEPVNAAADGWPYTSIRVRQRRTSFYFPCWEQSVKVTGRFGWAAIPAEVEQATTIITAKMLKRAREAPFGITMIGGDGAAVRAAREDPEVSLLLGPYVRENHS